MTTDERSSSRPVMVVALACVLAAVGVALSACNTVKGVGRDIEAVGQAGQDAIDDAGND